MSITKICTLCGEELPIMEFSLNGHNGKPRARCKECEREAARRWRENNKDKIKVYNSTEKRKASMKSRQNLYGDRQKRYRDSPRGKISNWNRKVVKDYKVASLDIDDIINVIDKYNGKCSCGDEFYTLTHIISLDKGGRHELDNIKPICRKKQCRDTTRNT